MKYIFSLFLNKEIQNYDVKKILFRVEYLKNNLNINNDSKTILFIYYLDNTNIVNLRKYIFENLNKNWLVKDIHFKSLSSEFSPGKFLNRKGNRNEKLKIINESFIELLCMGESAKLFCNDIVDLKNKSICLINVSNLTKLKASYISQSIPNFKHFPDDYIYLDRNIFSNIGLNHDWIITGKKNLCKFGEISKFIIYEDLENIDVNMQIKKGGLSKIIMKIKKLKFNNIPLVNIYLHKIAILHIKCKKTLKRNTIIKRAIRKIILLFLNKIDIYQNFPTYAMIKNNSKIIKLKSLENHNKSGALLKLFFQKNDLEKKIRFVSKLDFYDHL